MKVNVFLNLVKGMRNEQISYYATRGQYPGEAREHLIQAKMLERQVDAVIREGRLEPDQPTMTTTVSAEEERSLRLHLEDERDAGDQERYESDDDDLVERAA